MYINKGILKPCDQTELCALIILLLYTSVPPHKNLEYFFFKYRAKVNQPQCVSNFRTQNESTKICLQNL